MKYEENYTELDSKLLSLFYKFIPETFVEKLQEGGVEFDIPNDRELGFKVKYDVSEEGGSCSIKISWDFDLGNEDEEEEEESQDENED